MCASNKRRSSADGTRQKPTNYVNSANNAHRFNAAVYA